MATMETDLVAQKKLFSRSEVQQILGISRQTLYRMRKDGKIKGVMIGSQIRFSQQEIDSISTNGSAI